MAEASPDSGRAESAPILSGDDESSLEEWNTGLFDCWEDCHLTAEGLCCPQCLHADNATRIDRFATCCPYQCSYMCLSALLLCSCKSVWGSDWADLRAGKLDAPFA